MRFFDNYSDWVVDATTRQVGVSVKSERCQKNKSGRFAIGRAMIYGDQELRVQEVFRNTESELTSVETLLNLAYVGPKAGASAAVDGSIAPQPLGIDKDEPSEQKDAVTENDPVVQRHV